MEEAVTDTIIKGATQRIEDSQQANSNNHITSNVVELQNQKNFPEEGRNAANEAYGGVVNINSYVKENQQKATSLTNTDTNEQEK